eukprot:10137860-Lingulodinium_polyedra.AAC.1
MALCAGLGRQKPRIDPVAGVRLRMLYLSGAVHHVVPDVIGVEAAPLVIILINVAPFIRVNFFFFVSGSAV